MSQQLILASNSPRRMELLQQIGYSPIKEVSDIDEQVGITDPERLVKMLAMKKAEDVFSRHTGENVVVLGSDTVVSLDSDVLGKPTDEDDAFNMLMKLSGRKHRVSTGVSIFYTDNSSGKCVHEDFVSHADVWMYEHSKDEIWDYILTCEPMDKAGAYGIQGRGATLVERIEGDYYAIVGLPVAEVHRRLQRIMN